MGASYAETVTFSLQQKSIFCACSSSSMYEKESTQMVAEEMWNHFETKRGVSTAARSDRFKRTGRVDGCGGQVGGRRDGSVGMVVFGGVSRRTVDGNIAAESGMSKWELKVFGDLHRDFTRRGFAADETTPGFMGLVDDLHSILLVLSLARERELVLGLAIGDLVDPREARG